MLEVMKDKLDGELGGRSVYLELTPFDVLLSSKVEFVEFGDLDMICEGCGAVGWDSCGCQMNVWNLHNLADKSSQNFA